MDSLRPITIVIDGVERKLRSTLLTKFMIMERWPGKPLPQVLNEEGDKAFVEIAYFLMHDDDGNPPPDITVKKLLNSIPAKCSAELIGAVWSSMSNGDFPKEEAETMATNLMRMSPEELMSQLTGLNFSDSAPNVSASLRNNFGRNTSKSRLKRVSMHTTKVAAS